MPDMPNTDTLESAHARIAELEQKLSTPPRDRLGQPLTQREREVLELLWQDLRNTDMAARLHVSIKTIEAHRARIFRKLGARSVVGAIRSGLRLGLISMPEGEG